MSKFKFVLLFVLIYIFFTSSAMAKESEYKVKIGFQYDSIEELEDNLYSVQKNKQYGLVDKNGRTIMKLQPYALDYYSPVEGLISIYKNGKYGFINKSGKMVISPAWEDAMNFNDGIGIVGRDYKFTFIDTKGRQLFKNKYDYITYFSDGVAPVMMWDPKEVTRKIKLQEVPFYAGISGLGKWGLVDKKGNVIMSLKYDIIRPFIDDGNLFIISSNEKMGFADATGRIITKPTLSKVCYFPDNGNLCAVCQNDKWGFIDKTGKVVTKFEWDEEPIPIAGTKLWRVVKSNSSSEDYYRFDGIVDDTGMVVIEPKWHVICDFSDGMAEIRSEDDESGFINEEGKIVIQPSYYEVKKFSEGVAWVFGYIPQENTQFEYNEEMGRNLWRPIDKSDKYLSNKGWDKVSDFKNGYAVVSNNDGKSTVIDKNFNKVFDSDYEIVEILSSDFFAFKKYNKYGIMDKTGKIIFEASFSKCSLPQSLPEGIIASVTNSSWGKGSQIGYITKTGKLLCNTCWDEYTDYYQENLLRIQKSGKFGLVNVLNGSYVIKPQFEDLSFIRNENGESVWKAKKSGKYGVISLKKGA